MMDLEVSAAVGRQIPLEQIESELTFLLNTLKDTGEGPIQRARAAAQLHRDPRLPRNRKRVHDAGVGVRNAGRAPHPVHGVHQDLLLHTHG